MGDHRQISTKSFLTKQQPIISEIIAVTSITPNPARFNDQQAAIRSWKYFGLKIVSVNTAGEIEALQPKFPEIDEFLECNELSTAFPKPSQLINTLCDVSLTHDTTTLLINSDIRIYGDQSVLLNSLYDGRFPLGLRSNFSNDIDNTEGEVWGIDVFTMSPYMAQRMPRTQLAIGRPMWDYMVPHHIKKHKGRLHFLPDRYFFHRTHPLNWNDEMWHIGEKIVSSVYGWSNVDWHTFRRKWLIDG